MAIFITTIKRMTLTAEIDDATKFCNYVEANGGTIVSIASSPTAMGTHSLIVTYRADKEIRY